MWSDHCVGSDRFSSTGYPPVYDALASAHCSQISLSGGKSDMASQPVNVADVPIADIGPSPMQRLLR